MPLWTLAPTPVSKFRSLYPSFLFLFYFFICSTILRISELFKMILETDYCPCSGLNCVPPHPDSYACVLSQSCPTLCDPTNCSPPGSYVRGILQARSLEWIAIPFCRGLSCPWDRTRSPALQVGSLLSEPSLTGQKPKWRKLRDMIPLWGRIRYRKGSVWLQSQETLRALGTLRAVSLRARVLFQS